MQSGNPALKHDAFAPREWGGIMQDLQRAEAKSRPGAMTLQGTVIKTGILVGLCAITALVRATRSRPAAIRCRGWWVA